MPSVIQTINDTYKKPHVVDARSGDTVKVHQKIREGNKERIQIFEGLVIRTGRKGSHTQTITVRRIASGVGVEKTYMVHSPLVTKIEVTKRSKVRRNYLTYMRERTGKAAKLSSVAFDRDTTNFVPEPAKAEEPATEEASVDDPEELPVEPVKTVPTEEEIAPTEEAAPESEAPQEKAPEEKASADKSAAAKAETPKDK